ncbi:MAG: hypothetical protein IPP72_14660 [Chitinophagaceae bacterium]|nr:hypothetical protein [Chitinophagaceae bacterium]
MTGRRKQWFEQWLTETDSPTEASIFNFHRFAGDGDHTNSIFMNRDSQLFTVSITCIAMNAEEASMQYFDAKHNCTTQHSLSFETVNR